MDLNFGPAKSGAEGVNGLALNDGIPFQAVAPPTQRFILLAFVCFIKTRKKIENIFEI